MKKFPAFLICAALMISSGCHEDFLEDRAFSIITEDNFFRTSSDAVTAVNGVYNTLRENGLYQSDLLWLNEYPSELVTTRLNIGSSQSDMDLWNYQPGYFSSIYPASYRLIERANQVIARVPDVDMPSDLKNRIVGEALFLRALAYFNLVRVYGGVPLKVNPTADLEKLEFPRASAEAIYQLIIDDLERVISSNALPNTKAYTGDNKGRVGKSGAQTLLGKVYLTRAKEAFGTSSDLQSAVDILKAVVADGDHSLQANYSDVFLKENNSEIIFDIQNIRAPGLGGNLTSFVATSNTNELFIIPYYDFPANIDFYNSFAAGDTRRAATFHDKMKVPVSGSSVEVYFDPATDPYEGTWRRGDDNTLLSRSVVNAPVPGFRKFVDFDISARANAEEPNYVILRYSDVLLMLAEAINELSGPTAEAYEYINMVKRRAFGLPVNMSSGVDYTGLDKLAFAEAVYSERRKEFVMEGHSWFDGKRFWELYTQRVADASVGADPNISNRPKATIDVNTIRQEKYKLLPFSTDQLDLNPLLTQNPGW